MIFHRKGLRSLRNLKTHALVGNIPQDYDEEVNPEQKVIYMLYFSFPFFKTNDLITWSSEFD